MTPFDPTFDDCQWTDAWTQFPIIQVTPGVYDSFTVKSWQMSEADVCDQRIALSPPLEVRGLITSNGTLWMSDVPQERLMMFNNARASSGDVLVGGLGIGLYPQYAMPHIQSLTVIEVNPAIRRVVEPVVRITADAYRAPVEIRTDRIQSVLSAAPTVFYDTIFLDTWETIDASHLPAINRLRDRALHHVKPQGRVLLWGYAWMVRLFEDACRSLLSIAPAERIRWLEIMTRQRGNILHMMLGVLEHFEELVIDDLDSALDWCRSYATHYTGED